MGLRDRERDEPRLQGGLRADEQRQPGERAAAARPPGDAWTAITLTAGANDPVTVQVTKMRHASARSPGPITESWTIAQGTLKGIVYYNTYDSPLAQGDAGSQNDHGAVMRLRPGGTQPEVFIGGSAKGSCTVCHTLSANGSTMALNAGHAYDAVYTRLRRRELADRPNLGAAGHRLQLRRAHARREVPPLLRLDGARRRRRRRRPGEPRRLRAQRRLDDPRARLAALRDGRRRRRRVRSRASRRRSCRRSRPTGRSSSSTATRTGRTSASRSCRSTRRRSPSARITDVFVDPGYYLSWPSFLPDSQNFVFHDERRHGPVLDLPARSRYNDADGELLHVHAGDRTTCATCARRWDKTVTIPDGGRGARHVPLNPDGTTAARTHSRTTSRRRSPSPPAGYYWVVFTSRRSYGNTIDNSDPNDTPAEREAQEALGRPRSTSTATPAERLEPPRVLPPRAGARRGQHARVLDAAAVRGERRVAASPGPTAATASAGRSPTTAGTTFACVAPPVGCSNTDEKCTHLGRLLRHARRAESSASPASARSRRRSEREPVAQLAHSRGAPPRAPGTAKIKIVEGSRAVSVYAPSRLAGTKPGACGESSPTTPAASPS